MFQELTNLLVAYPALQVLIIVLAVLIVIYLDLKRDSISKKIWLPVSIVSGLVLGAAIIAALKTAGDNRIYFVLYAGLIAVILARLTYVKKRK